MTTPEIHAEQELKAELLHRFSQKGVPLPYLFFGSGMSLRYLGLPNWEQLMIEFSDRSDLDTRFELSEAEGDYPGMATKLAGAFHPIWHKDDAYTQQRLKYPDALGKENILKIAVSEFLQERSELTAGVPGVDDPKLRSELEALRQANVDGIITTNYDTLTDQLFPDFPSFVGQTDLLLGQAQFIGEIYKIHGSVKKPESLVLTTQDYEWLDTRNPYLMAKLVTIFAEHPIIFAGYSVQDKYIENMLVELSRAVGDQRTKKFTQNFYFLEYDSDENSIPGIIENRIISRESVLPMTVIRTNSYRWIWEVLAELKRQIPTNFLRQVKEQIYDIVRNPSPDEERQTVHSVPYGEGGDELKFVYGFGQFTETQMNEIREMGNSWTDGFAGNILRREDLLRDVLAGEGEHLPADIVLKSGIPDHIEPQNSDYIPVHKYLAEDGRISGSNVDFSGLPDIIEKLYLRQIAPYADTVRAFKREFPEIGLSDVSIEDIMSTNRSQQFKLDALTYRMTGALVDSDLLDEVREVLLAEFEASQTSQLASVYRKAVAAYSLAKWIPGEEES